jgi:hypothetical protein
MNISVQEYHQHFILKTEDNKLHILNLKSMIWNLKQVFGLSKIQINQVTRIISQNGIAYFRIEKSRIEPSKSVIRFYQKVG